MLRWVSYIGVLGVVAVGSYAAIAAFWPSLIWPAQEIPSALSTGNAKRGERLFNIAGCGACHTDTAKGAKRLAGGRQMDTEFGTFYTPNITPDKETGIGSWTMADFVRAMTQGISPTGKHYYPSFPYTSYTRMTLPDLADLKAYLDTVAPVRRKNKPHEMDFPFSQRAGIGIWKAVYFDPGRYRNDPSRSQEWNRGAYLALGPGHCAECHSPRNFAGALIKNRLFAGTKRSPDGSRVPNISQHEQGLKKWSHGDIVFGLQTGLLPSGDVMGGKMAEVVRNLGKVPEDDIKALATFLKSLPAKK